MSARRESGFTILEMLVVGVLVLALVGLGALAVRHYWFVQSFNGAQSALVSELRAQQQHAAARSYPYAQGVWFLPGSGRWGTVEYNVETEACTKNRDQTLDQVVVSTASFTTLSPHTANCRTAVGDNTAQIAFFFPGGTAAGGSLSLTHPRLSSPPKTVEVSSLTARVTAP